jgi:hypothetical protein
MEITMQEFPFDPFSQMKLPESLKKKFVSLGRFACDMRLYYIGGRLFAAFEE